MPNLNRLSLFFAGSIYVFLIAINTVFITKNMLWGIFLSGFVISFFWTLNVRKVVCSSFIDQIYYGLGGATGCLLGAITVNSLL